MEHLLIIYGSLVIIGCIISGTAGYVHAGRFKKRKENKR